MNTRDTFRLRAQLEILKDVVTNFPHRTIENIIQNIEAILKVRERNEG